VLKGANILDVAKAWQKKKADAGWACLHWPKEYGGRGSSPIERVIWQQEEGPVRKTLGHVHYRPRHVRPDHDGVRR
jgi:alkylation response protein AidB-like acyl-CoA dehydrogenase